MAMAHDSASQHGSPNPERSARIDNSDRATFTSEELATVLSHYDLGVIDSMQAFPRGSRRAPKLVLKTDRGTYLLKRRAKGRDNPFKVAFAHAMQLYLTTKEFPLPNLIGTRRDNNSMLQLRGNIYEVFEYAAGTGYDNGLDSTHDAGKTLGRLHQLLRDYEAEYDPPQGSYHAARGVQESMRNIPATLRDDPAVNEQPDRVREIIQFLHGNYNEAALRVNEMGLTEWPMQIIHSDWHPGNMLFRGPRVVAVIDYDAARIQQRVIDVANGALQFSIIGGGDDAAHWPEYLDESRFKRFMRGYESVSALSEAERHTIPPLMVEALIAESVIPIAATGSFARMEGFGFLLMIQRKVTWLKKHADRLCAMLDA
ncbi:MAG: hypothetical protein CMJ49_09635 [Planctomycetaceae bacterium]|nr:hypothetical protein [Planctomycetaceae bacterium]